jgi:uncharacterized protein (TIGR02246 family)
MTGPQRDDREAIVALVGAYAERLDAGDLDGVARLFEDGAFCSAQPGTVRRGADEVRRMYDPVILYDDGTPRTKHVLGNISVSVDGADATASCTFTVMQEAPGRPLRPVLAGRYVDRFTRADDGWRFEERVVHPDLVGALSDHMGAPGPPRP